MEKDIVNILTSMVYDRSYYEIVSDFFELSAISIRNTVDLRPPLRQKYEERYSQTAKHYNSEQLQKFGQALAIMMVKFGKKRNYVRFDIERNLGDSIRTNFKRKITVEEFNTILDIVNLQKFKIK